MKKIVVLLIITLCFTGCLSKQEVNIIDVKQDNTINYNLTYKNEFIERKNNIAKNDFEKWDNLLNDIYKYLQNNMNAEEFEKLKKDELDWIKFKEDALKKFPENSDNIKITYTKERCNYLISLLDDMKYVKDDSIFYEEDDAIYYFINGYFVGHYKEGQYISRGGIDGNWEFNASLRKILAKPGYDLYDMEKKIGIGKKINEFLLPLNLEKDPEDLAHTSVFIDDIDFHGLATNATHNLFPRRIQICEFDEEIEKVINEIQENNNFYIEENIDMDNTIILCDLDGDGGKEKLIISNSETFSIIAIIKSNGEYDVVYKDFGVDISLAGIYDLDNDEEYEICVAFWWTDEGHGGHEGVFDKIDNKWHLVMRSTTSW